MYPLTQWTHTDLMTRLRGLADAGFLQESVVGAAQVLEQVLKRVLRSHMVERRYTVRRPLRRLERVPAGCREDVDGALRSYAQSVSGIKDMWRVVFEGERWRSLPSLVDDIAGNGSWMRFSSTKQIHVAGDRRPLACGLIGLRHRLVHDTHSPPRALIVTLTQEGLRLAEKLLSPDSWERRGLRSPFRRVFAFRVRTARRQ